jgi:hypothetical protein
LCPLIYFALVMLAHAVTGNWKYLWLEPTTDLIASRRTLNDFYYLVLRLPIMGAICAAMLCWFWQLIDRALGARQDGDTPGQQLA